MKFRLIILILVAVGLAFTPLTRSEEAPLLEKKLRLDKKSISTSKTHFKRRNVLPDVM
ncbi:hypothetical protein ACSX1A_09535 [Pontibacter sp. MBLB2868]|uniref:hypothetical protein n=1 Tax=Pontibacter sp. MBLB2868 TaxID=3451555 RepID=UPI003F752C22